jgi:hypothetical protein
MFHALSPFFILLAKQEGLGRTNLSDLKVTPKTTERQSVETV